MRVCAWSLISENLLHIYIDYCNELVANKMTYVDVIFFTRFPTFSYINSGFIYIICIFFYTKIYNLSENVLPLQQR